MMKYFRHLITITVLFSTFFLLTPRIAHAYLDPGTGSLIIQLIIGALIGISFTIKMYWRKIKVSLTTYLSKRKKDKKDNDQ